MRDITSKQISLRTATGIGFVFFSQEILQLVKEDKLPKGNLLDIAKAAGLLAAKNTQHLIPHCHPVSIDGMEISFKLIEPGKNIDIEIPEVYKDNFGIAVMAEGKSIGRTGIEMEALTAVSVSALTIYDLLKPLGNKNIEISGIKLLKKTGGKSDREKYIKRNYQAAVLVCSDSTASGKRKDSSGVIIQEMLKVHNAEIVDYKIIPDDVMLIQRQIKEWVEKDIPFIFTTGGTGLSPKDYTVDAVKEILEKEAPGIVEAMRVFGNMRTPLAMMSRSVAGTIGKTLIVTLPGSSNGSKESLEAILPAVFHARSMLMGGGH
ncbi:MAG: bifunctional molybdenum cofactor biosynthesis protein MoaC/MoaB [Cytophagaceae bacterium]|nr:bifunctional molybdenum cofactor biosynthesis protein MoaC/MoaB [Cytophagaceae bacterium]